MTPEEKKRVCSKCGEEKSLTEFHKRADGKSGGRRTDCAVCNTKQSLEWTENNLEQKLENNKQWKHKNPDRVRNSYLLATYGITLEQYNELLEKQNGCCAVCKRHHTQFKTNLAVEHDHHTKEIQGLCCAYCNRNLIGRIRDPSLFRAAAEYLEFSHTGWYVPVRKKKKKKKGIK